MKFLAKLSGTWQQAKLLFVKVAGVWKVGRGAYVKVAGEWKLIYSRPRYTVHAQGLLQTVEPQSKRGFWINGNPPSTTNWGRSYTLVQFGMHGLVIYNETFDLHAGGNVENQTAAATELRIAFDNMLPGQVFVLFTYDEPASGRLLGGLPEALYAKGVTQSIFESIQYRGAYCILGQAGGSALFEKYIGESVGTGNDDGDRLAAVGIDFIIDGDEIIIVNTW